jgi:3D (Asp-Asp-Asp) domain-containing protein
MEIIQHKINNKKRKFGDFKDFFTKFSKKGFVLPVWGKKIDLPVEAFFFEKKLKFPKKVVLGLIIAILFNFVGFFTPALAAEAVVEANIIQTEIVAPNGAALDEKEVELIQENLVIIEHLPTAGELTLTDMGVRTITAYNSESAQTDASPCITANGFNVCEHGVEDTIAANFLKFGTKVRIPELFGDKIFIVRDRMNTRYPERVDVWMVDRTDSVVFGVKQAKIEAVLE